MVIGAQKLHNKLKSELTDTIKQNYSVQEINTTLQWLLEYTLGITRTDILIDKEVALSAIQQEQLNRSIERLNREEPIQYILKECEFYGRKFVVTPNVLIPRPETEELVHLIVQQHTKNKSLKVLDIGTGSGCIAITLNKELSQSKVWALDNSPNALTIARQNALNLQSSIELVEINILVDLPKIKQLDIIVSNPPYVLNSEKANMRQNVLNYEPPTALFVEDADPLLFYRRISEICTHQLASVKWVYLEVHEKFAKEIKELLIKGRFLETHIVQDAQHKDRFIVAYR